MRSLGGGEFDLMRGREGERCERTKEGEQKGKGKKRMCKVKVRMRQREE